MACRTAQPHARRPPVGAAASQRLTRSQQGVVSHHRLPPHFVHHPPRRVADAPVPAAQLRRGQRGARGARAAATQRRRLLLLWQQREANAAGTEAGWLGSG